MAIKSNWPRLIALALALFCSSLALGAPPDAAREARRVAAEGNYDVAALMFQALINQNPHDPSLRSGLADCFHRLKRYDEAIEGWKACIAAGGAPASNMFNIACGHAMAGRPDEALEWLERSLEAGFPEQATLENDNDMVVLRKEPRFIQLTGLNPPEGLDRNAQWLYDLDFFARRMRQMHWDLYGRVSEEQFHDELERLKADVPKLKDHQVVMRLARIVTLVGDGHTNLRMARDEAVAEIPVLPIRFYQFSDGLHVLAAAAPHEDLVGARVIRIGSLDSEAAFEAAKAYCPTDNAMGFLDMVPIRLRLPWLLEAIGATDGIEQVQLEVQLIDGSHKTVALSPIASGPPPSSQIDLQSRTGERMANHGAEAPTPIHLEDRPGPIWQEHRPEQKLVYVRFSGIANPPGSSLGRFTEELTKFIDERDDAEYLVLDMRFNGGGNTGLVLPFIHALVRSEELSQPGRLFVIIGRRTFSAAMNTTSLLEIHTPATFVGEPTGSSPNCVGESTYFRLPYHGNRVFCSSRYWQFQSSTDQRKWVAPQFAAPLTSRDFAANRDPAMEAVLGAIQAGWPESPAVQSPPPQAARSPGQ